MQESKAYGTRCSQAVPHPSTILARRCLTSVIGRERVCSSWYGRRQRDAFGSESDYLVFRSSCTPACTLVCEYARTHLSMHAMHMHACVHAQQHTAFCASLPCAWHSPHLHGIEGVHDEVHMPAKSHARTSPCEKFGTLHEFACHPCAGAMLIFSVSFQF